jgi:hypothetical protein
VASVEEHLEEARRLDVASTQGRFRLGDLTEALSRELPAVADLLGRLAIDLEVDRDTIAESWFVAAAFPPATRRPGLPWSTYLILRFHPERHGLVDHAASAGWGQARIQQAVGSLCRRPPPQPARPVRIGCAGRPTRVDPRPVGRDPVACSGGAMSPRRDLGSAGGPGRARLDRRAGLIPAESR